MLLISILIFILLGYNLRYFLSSLYFRITAAVNFLFFMTATGFYMVADYFTLDGVNEAVLYHLRTGLEGTGFTEYKLLITLSIFWLITTFCGTFLIYKTKRYSGKKVKLSNKYKSAGVRVFISLLFFIIPWLTHPLSWNIFEFIKTCQANTYSESPSFSQLAPLSPNTTENKFSNFYIEPEIRKNRLKPLNLLLIYLEGLESTYFNEKSFPGLIYNLKKLAEQSLFFSDIRQLYGTGWTVAGMTASQCGIPLVTPFSMENSMGAMNNFLPQATGIGDLLQREGYHLTYMGGSSKKFAGKENFYATHGFTEIYGKENLLPQLSNPKYCSGWGLFDDSLFDLAFKKFISLSKLNKPFGLCLLTLDTHHPYGHPSLSSREIKYGDGSNKMLNAVHGEDWLVSRFIRKILRSQYSHNTLICLVSDHLCQHNTATKLLNKLERKNLFMILAPDIEEKRVVSRAGSTLDIGATLLSKLGFSVKGVGLGRNLLDHNNTTFVEEFGKDADQVLTSWRKNFMGFWGFPTISDKTIIDPVLESAAIGGQRLKIPVLLRLDENQKIEQIRYAHETQSELVKYVAGLKNNQPFIWIDKGRCPDAAYDEKNRDPGNNYFYYIGTLASKKPVSGSIDKRETLLQESIKKAILSDQVSEYAQKRRQRLQNSTRYVLADIPGERSGLSNEEFVISVYKNLLQRTPDTGGYKFWSNWLNGGGDRLSFIKKIKNGYEYNNLNPKNKK